jgi:C-terminal peptidase prc
VARPLLLIFLALVWLAGTPAFAQTPGPDATPPARAPAASATVSVSGAAGVDAALRAIEAELDLLLRLYPTPLDAGALLDAAWRGVGDDAGGAAPPGTPLPADRAAAWAAFRDRFGALASMPPGAADVARLARAANQAMARSVDDCHTRFAPDYAQETGALGRSEPYGGVGATILEPQSIDPAPPGPVIVGLVENGPAMRAGLRIGDAVLAVDGMPASGVASSRLAERVRGTPGTSVRLRVERPGEATPLELAVDRELVQFPLVEARTLGQPDGTTVGYVRLRSFVGPSVAEVRGALERLHAAGAGQWVLDLRDNPGGDLGTFRRIASSLIPQGTLAVTTDRGGKVAHLPADGRAFVPFVQPLAVLVDGHSASAAELLAADLQDYGLARLFGTATAG